MKIKVSQQDIDNGKKDNCAHCPVALALKRQLRVYDVVVRYLYIKTFSKKNDKTTFTIYRMTDKIYEFIYSFDKGEKVKPFEFELLPL